MGNNFGIRGLGPKTVTKLERLGIKNCFDLLHHYPSRYLDFSNHVAISKVEPNSSATVTGVLTNFQNIFTRSHKNIQKATLQDNTGKISLIWFNQPYLSKNLLVGESYTFAGTISSYRGQLTMIAPLHLHGQGNGIVPVYPETKGLTSGWFRLNLPKNLDYLLSDITDPLPLAVRQKFSLLDLATSLKEIHSPSSFDLLKSATYRLGLDEILSLQAHSFISRENWSKKTPLQIFVQTPRIKAHINKFIDSLPFKLTASQKSAWDEISADLIAPTPANRLIQGEVGSGKTILAVLSCLLSHHNQAASLLIAPTEILARQHFDTFSKLLPEIPIIFISGSSPPVRKKIKPGSIVISTHAAIYKKNIFSGSIGLLIIDEQHKFGVRQRSFLTDTLHPPHTLTMTATPIPRTVSLTMMGDLSLTTLKSIPSGRPPIKTFLVPTHKQHDCYLWLKKHIQVSKEQAFIVCPFIEASETMESVKSAVRVFEDIKPLFSGLKLGLIHGRISVPEREAILKDFLNNKINILVSTPMIEVGIDFPNSTTIIIQSADRFGLAQLHQLRGRVGRGSHQSYCYLFSESQNEKAISRLNYLETHLDGQKISEFDLRTRGPGELYSIIQHGFPSLKLAHLSDFELISTGQKIIQDILNTDPNFNFSTLLVHGDNQAMAFSS